MLCTWHQNYYFWNVSEVWGFLPSIYLIRESIISSAWFEVYLSCSIAHPLVAFIEIVFSSLLKYWSWPHLLLVNFAWNCRFLLRFTGKEEEINLTGDGNEKPEFVEWAWTPAQVIELVSKTNLLLLLCLMGRSFQSDTMLCVS